MIKLKITSVTLGIAIITMVACNRGNDTGLTSTKGEEGIGSRNDIGLTPAKVTEGIGNCLISQYPGLSMEERAGGDERNIIRVYDLDVGSGFNTRFKYKKSDQRFMLATTIMEPTRLKNLMEGLDNMKYYFRPCIFKVPDGITCIQSSRRPDPPKFPLIRTAFFKSGNTIAFYSSGEFDSLDSEIQLLEKIGKCIALYSSNDFEYLDSENYWKAPR